MRAVEGYEHHVTIMKKLFSILLAVVAGFIVLPEKVDARHYDSGYVYVSGYTRCGCPIHTKRVVTRYDYYGRPIYSYYTLPVDHRCRDHYRSGVTIQVGNGIYYSNHQPTYYRQRHVRHYPTRHTYYGGRSSHYHGHRTCR